MKKLTIVIILLTFNLNAQIKFPGFNEIGKGYNVFGEFANSESVITNELFDFTKIETIKNGYGHTIPKFIRVDNISSHRTKSVEGSSMKEYISNLSTEVGLSADAYFFKASIKRQFNTTNTQTSNVFYYTYMDINTKWRVSIDIRNIDTLINFLSLQFKNDLETLSPETLFQTYGTHFIASAYFGGRIDYSSITEINTNTNTNTLKSALDAKYKIISGDFNSNNYNSELSSSSKNTTSLNVIGGNSEFTNNINNTEQYKKWAEGIKEDPVLCEFDNKSLIPIWVLTNNSVRKKELEDYFNNITLKKYPLPIFFKKDEILDNEKIYKKFNVNITGFMINNDCDEGTYLTGDEDGEFLYEIIVYINDEKVKTFQSKQVSKVWSGNFLNINKNTQITVPYIENANIKIQCELVEVDTYTDNELVGNEIQIHKLPFSLNDLYNFEDNENNLYWRANLYRDKGCNATLFYQITPIINNTAKDFGSKGWYEFEKGNLDGCLYYSKEALKEDNSLWFVHYNVALVYLIQGNPLAFEKYKFTTNLCTNKNTINAALKDIIDYEAKNGMLKNSERVKLFLKSKL